jgi:hypothetical protein
MIFEMSLGSRAPFRCMGSNESVHKALGYAMPRKEVLLFRYAGFVRHPKATSRIRYPQ